MSRPVTITTGIDCMKELLDEIPAGPWPADDLHELRRSAMSLTCTVLHRFPEPG